MIESDDLKKRVWDKFIILLSIKTFGEAEVISSRKLIKNFLGSVESHKETFIEAFDAVTDEMLEEIDI